MPGLTQKETDAIIKFLENRKKRLERKLIPDSRLSEKEKKLVIDYMSKHLSKCSLCKRTRLLKKQISWLTSAKRLKTGIVLASYRRSGGGGYLVKVKGGRLVQCDRALIETNLFKKVIRKIQDFIHKIQVNRKVIDLWIKDYKLSGY